MCQRNCPFGKVEKVEIVNGKCEIGEGCDCYYGFPSFKAHEVEQMFRDNVDKLELKVMRY